MITRPPEHTKAADKHPVSPVHERKDLMLEPTEFLCQPLPGLGTMDLIQRSLTEQLALDDKADVSDP